MLKGYKYTGDETFQLSLYPKENCDFTNVKIKVKNDFNLVGLNSIEEKTAGNFLASLTKRSATEELVNAIFDDKGIFLGGYNFETRDFSNQNSELSLSGESSITLEPTKAYWINYNGENDKTFFGHQGNYQNKFD